MTKNTDNKEKFKTEVIKDNLLYVKLSDVNTEEDLEDLQKWAKENKLIIQEIYSTTHKKVKTLVDLKDFRNYKAETFSILSDLIKKNEDYADKTAVINSTPFLNLALDVLVAHSQTKTLFKSFSSKEEALKWLETDQ